MIDAFLGMIGLERRAARLAGGHPRDPALSSFCSVGADNEAGVNVNETTAMNLAAVFRAVSILSSSISNLPLRMFENIGSDLSGDEDRQLAPNHPLDAILNDEPNPEMDAATFRETLQGHVLTWGNGYAEKELTGGNELLYLWPLSPDCVKVTRSGRELIYKVRRDNGTEDSLPADRMFHIAGLGYDGLVGYSVLTKARQAIALGIAAETFGARFFGKGTNIGGIIQRPLGAKWKDDAATRFRTDFANWHQGLGKSHRVAVLEDGMTFQRLGVNPDDAQFLETRKFQVTEIARWFGVPPHLLYDLDRSTNNNIEQQGLEFLTYSLGYWLNKWERAVKRCLIPTENRRKYFAAHVTDQLLRADITARYTAYNTGRQGGWLSINDIRRRENMPPIKNGDTYLEPLNMTPAGAQAAAGGDATTPKTKAADNEAEAKTNDSTAA